MAAKGQGTRPEHLAAVEYDAAARRQYSFSRLTGMLHARTAGIDAGPLEGEASGEPPLDALGLGTLVHAVLEEIDFAQPGNVVERVRRLAEQHLYGAERQREESLAIELIERFAASPRAAQLIAAEETFRELEFLLAWPPDVGGKQECCSAAEKRPLLARGHRLSLPRCRRRVAADRLQNQSSDSGNVGGEGGRV